jgi:(2Fe-2S) ferredoxin
MAMFEYHLFVCTHGPYCCFDGDTDALFRLLKKGAAEAGCGDRVRVNRAGCFNQCGHGPMIVVYPEEVWYAGVQLSDVPEIVREHLRNGRPVERLRFQAPPGSNKDTAGYSDEVQGFKDIDAQIDEQRAAARQAVLERLRQRMPAPD